MWIFNRTKPPLDVPATFEERLRKLELRQTKIDGEIMDLAIGQDLLRNKVLRKIQKPREEALEENEPNKPKEDVLLPDK